MEYSIADINLCGHILLFLRLFALLEKVGKVFRDALQNSCLMEVLMAVSMDAFPKNVIVFLFLAVAVPRWIGYAVLGAATGRVVGTLFDETSIILLVLAIVVFCLGQILEYGWLLQDESYEII